MENRRRVTQNKNKLTFLVFPYYTGKTNITEYFLKEEERRDKYIFWKDLTMLVLSRVKVTSAKELLVNIAISISK